MPRLTAKKIGDSLVRGSFSNRVCRSVRICVLCLDIAALPSRARRLCGISYFAMNRGSFPVRLSPTARIVRVDPEVNFRCSRARPARPISTSRSSCVEPELSRMVTPFVIFTGGRVCTRHKTIPRTPTAMTAAATMDLSDAFTGYLRGHVPSRSRARR